MNRPNPYLDESESSEERITLDGDRLLADLKEECYGAAFGGGFGGALMEASVLDHASPEELIEKAKQMGFDLDDYVI